MMRLRPVFDKQACETAGELCLFSSSAAFAEESPAPRQTRRGFSGE
jgi:hypothetical protein